MSSSFTVSSSSLASQPAYTADWSYIGTEPRFAEPSLQLLPTGISYGTSSAHDEESGSSCSGGLTPTPKENPSQAGLDWLTDLIQDLESTSSPCVSPSSSSSTTTTTRSSPSIFRNPSEAAAYLKRDTRPDLDVQRALVDDYKKERLEATVRKWQAERNTCGLEYEDQRVITLRILVHEAASRSLASLRKRTELARGKRSPPPPPPCSVDADVDAALSAAFCSASSNMRKSSIQEALEKDADYKDARLRMFCAWKAIDDAVVGDAFEEGWTGPQRLLSCMCIFSPVLSSDVEKVPYCPNSDLPLPCVYGENNEDLAKRKNRQVQTIRTLKLQRAVQLRRVPKTSTAEVGSPRSPSLFLGNSNMKISAQTAAPICDWRATLNSLQSARSQ